MRAIWWAALLAGASYLVATRVTADPIALAIWKGAGVGLIALWAAAMARNRDGWLFAVVFALHAAGDVLLETSGMTVGGAAFFAGHLVAIWLYLANLRPAPSSSQQVLAAGLVFGTPLIAWLLTRDIGVAIYALGVGAMAGTAWRSRFPRYRVGLGAVLFVISDLLIFARMGPLAGAAWPGLLIWPLYFGGQMLIATSGVRIVHDRRGVTR